MLDLASWGGRAGAAATAAELQALGVQVNLIRKDDYLPAVMIGAAPGSSSVAVMPPEPTLGANGAGEAGALGELEEAQPAAPVGAAQ